MFNYKKIFFISMLILTSCSTVLKKQELCKNFIINTDNKKYDLPLNFVVLKENLTKKLELIKSKNSKNVCKINIYTTNEVYDGFSDSDGISSRNNIKTHINIKMFIKDKLIFEDKTGFFYYNNVLQHRYSDYNNKNNNLNNKITDELFLIIKNNINKLDK